jgi:tRNA(fMet)-specific endonuclease VapC
MMKFMLDTDICICMIRQAPRPVLDQLNRTSPGDVCISAITLSELEYGAFKSSRAEQNRMRLAEFIAPLQVAPFESAAAAEYGSLRAGLEKLGNLIGPLDLLIAAHALALDCALVTNNESEFSRVPGLRVLNWAKQRPDDELVNEQPAGYVGTSRRSNRQQSARRIAGRAHRQPTAGRKV